MPLSSFIQQDTAHSLAISPDGRWIVSGSGDESVRIWDTWKTAARCTLRDVGYMVDFIPAGGYFASGGDGGCDEYLETPVRVTWRQSSSQLARISAPPHQAFLSQSSGPLLLGHASRPIHSINSTHPKGRSVRLPSSYVVHCTDVRKSALVHSRRILLHFNYQSQQCGLWNNFTTRIKIYNAHK
jgi:hypothetical protein